MIRSTALVLLSSFLLASTVAAAPRVYIPKSLLRTRQNGTPPTPDDNGHCPATANLCPTGGCCDNGTFCQATDEEGTIFLCVTDRDIPDNHGKCDAGLELCQTGGCCATECLATDDEGTIFVCAPSPQPPSGPVGTPPTPDDNGHCPASANLCPTGGCCDNGTFCMASDEEGTIFVCVTDRDIPGSTTPIPDNHGKCDAGLELCPTGGCCATTCAATDDEGTIFVCTPPARKLV